MKRIEIMKKEKLFKLTIILINKMMNKKVKMEIKMGIIMIIKKS
jgi:hypothetical protein